MSCPQKKPPRLAGRPLRGGEGRDAPEKHRETEAYNLRREGEGRTKKGKKARKFSGRRPRKKPESGRVGGGEAAGRGNQGERKRETRGEKKGNRERKKGTQRPKPLLGGEEMVMSWCEEGRKTGRASSIYTKLGPRRQGEFRRRWG